MMLDTLRTQIDDIDTQIVALIAKRMSIVDDVIDYKLRNDTEASQPGRWQEILDRRAAQAEQLGLDADVILSIRDQLHEYSKQTQRTKGVS